MSTDTSTAMAALAMDLPIDLYEGPAFRFHHAPLIHVCSFSWNILAKRRSVNYRKGRNRKAWSLVAASSSFISSRVFGKSVWSRIGNQMDQWINPSHLNKSVLRQVQLKSITYVALSLGLINSFQEPARATNWFPGTGHLSSFCKKETTLSCGARLKFESEYTALSVANSGNLLKEGKTVMRCPYPMFIRVHWEMSFHLVLGIHSPFTPSPACTSLFSFPFERREANEVDRLTYDLRAGWRS